MIINDYALHICAEKGLVNPYYPEHLQPVSIDLTLGDHLRVETPSWSPKSIGPAEDGNCWESRSISDKPYRLMPGEFILAHTAESVCIPDDCCGDLVLRSTAARMGFDHCLSGLCDPGFEGQLTLELRNNLRFHSLEVREGMRLCQLILHKLNGMVLHNYRERGNYQYQQGATDSNYNLEAMH